MKAVAIALTFGRASVCELLAMMQRQTRPLPVLLWVDAVPLTVDTAGMRIDVVHGPPFNSRSVAGIRRASVEAARKLYGLGPRDALLVIDDDDFYSSRHFELLLGMLESDPDLQWTSCRRFGLEHEPNTVPQDVTFESGPGQHGCWAYRLAHYDAAGGYRDEDLACDPRLAVRMGFHTCSPHSFVTHVRRHHGLNISSRHVNHDRELMRAKSELVDHARPVWSQRCAELEEWCRLHFTPPLG